MISRWINPAIPLFIHSIRNMLFSFSSGSRTCRMIQSPLPSYSTHSTVQTICLKFKFYKGEKGRASKHILQPPTPHLHCRKPTVGRTSFTSKCDWPWVSDNAAPLNFKKRKNVAKQSNNIRIEKEKKRETVIYNSPRAYRSLLNSSYIRYKLR